MIRFLAVFVMSFFLLSLSAQAQESIMPKQDDRVVFDISSEGWVTTKTARVTINVEAAVSGSNAGSMRGDMMKAVNDLAKGDWRLLSFDRTQDQTGLERWSAVFEARLPETALNGLADAAKKQSRAGMQLSINDTDFSPTLDEMEAARAAVRTQIYKSASDQLAALNAALPGRTYRIATINFTGDETVATPMMPQVMRGPAPMMKAMALSATAPEASPPAPMERAEKVTLTARIVFAATPPAIAPQR